MQVKNQTIKSLLKIHNFLLLLPFLLFSNTIHSLKIKIISQQFFFFPNKRKVNASFKNAPADAPSAAIPDNFGKLPPRQTTRYVSKWRLPPLFSHRITFVQCNAFGAHRRDKQLECKGKHGKMRLDFCWNFGFKNALFFFQILYPFCRTYVIHPLLYIASKKLACIRAKLCSNHVCFVRRLRRCWRYAPLATTWVSGTG